MFRKRYDQETIISILDRLGIKRGKIRNGYIKIHCPLPQHHGKYNFSNCSIFIDTGIISCFVCGKGHINQFLKHEEKIKPIVTLDFSKEKEKKKYNNVNKDGKYKFTHILLNPTKYFYTTARGFTKEFCEEFNIRECLSGWYNDYLIIPILDKKQNIVDFEARKLKEYEYLKRYYTSDESLTILRQKFKDDRFENKLDENNDLVEYLLKPKVLYQAGSKIYSTLWNIDNLDRDKTLYIVEGTGSLCRIYYGLSKNVTCIFGAKLDKQQIIYLKEFKDIVVIPDYDEAGSALVNNLHQELGEFKICSIKTEDTDRSYINDIKNAIKNENLITSTRYIYYLYYKKIKENNNGI